MFWPFKKKQTFDNNQRLHFAQTISTLLLMQIDVIEMRKGNRSIEDSEGRFNRKALGYIYGYIDAALQTIRQDMSDTTIGLPITYQVLNHLFPDRGEVYTKFLIDHMGKDEDVTLGAMTGGQQYIKYSQQGSKGIPMGLVRFIIEDDKKTDKNRNQKDQSFESEEKLTSERNSPLISLKLPNGARIIPKTRMRPDGSLEILNRESLPIPKSTRQSSTVPNTPSKLEKK